MSHSITPEKRSAAWAARAAAILDSFRRLLGRELIDRSGDPREDARRLFELPLGVLAYDTAATPLLDWANAAAATAFDASPEELVGRPSAATAPADAMADRQELFSLLRRHGFVTGYSGTRISATGRRFVIEDVTVLELRDVCGKPAGHAAIIGKTRPEAAAGGETFQRPSGTVP